MALYVCFVGNQLTPNLNPFLFDLANDDIGKAFAKEFHTKAISLISQTPDELATRLLRTRQSWAFDVTPIQERPLLEVMPGKYCCPDLTLFVRTFVDRIYFLLQEAYGKDEFRSLFGKLFECYIHRLVNEFAVTKGPLRTYLACPRFSGKQNEASDGILLWNSTAAMMEYKGGLLTTRQRLAGVPVELFQGIETLASKISGSKRKGIGQLAANIARVLSCESQVVCQGNTFDLSMCTRIYPVLICFEEALGIHAMQKRLQPIFDEEIAKAGISPDRIQTLLVLTIRDIECLATVGQSISFGKVLDEYAEHLTSQPKDYTGSFSRFIRYNYGSSLQPENSITYRKHREAIEEIMKRFPDIQQDENINS